MLSWSAGPTTRQIAGPTIRSRCVLHDSDQASKTHASVIYKVLLLLDIPWSTVFGMGKFYDSIPPNLVKWIEAQQMFWVASAPLGGDGHVNLSPKGLKGTLHIVNETQVWYEDMTGSGTYIACPPLHGRFV